MTILETIEPTGTPIYIHVLLILISIAASVTWVAWAHDDWKIGGVGAIIVIILIAITAWADARTKVTSKEATYLIEVSDFITLNEFYKQYEIIEHLPYSNVYKVKER